MRVSISAATALAILAATVVEAAPAPVIVTVYNTAAQTDTVVASTAAAAAPATSAAAAPAAASSGGSGSFWSSLVDLFDGDSSSSSSSTSSAAPSLSSSSGGLGGFFSSLMSNSNVKSWLSDFGFGSDSSSSASTAPSAASSSAPAATSSASPLFGSLPSSTTAASSQSLATSDGGDDIASSGVDTDFAQSMLDIHNKYRAEHSSGPLSWDDAAYQYAKRNADSYDCSGVLTHTHGQFGENLACGFKDGPSAVTAWYEEGQTYNYKSANEYNHFTQVVWKGSTKMGCAMKDCSGNNWGHYVVCEYDPPGNVIGHNAQNVLP